LLVDEYRAVGAMPGRRYWSLSKELQAGHKGERDGTRDERGHVRAGPPPRAPDHA
jgi:hypothetical protein